MISLDCVIIGAGVIGLSVAYKLSEKYPELDILLAEKEITKGLGISSRNSEVIHSGIYYPKNSLKATLSVEGNKMLYEFCKKFNVSYEKSEKLIIACTEDELSKLNTLYHQGISNGLENLKLINKDIVGKLEPEISAWGAILIPTTGILSVHELMDKFEVLIKKNSVFAAYEYEAKSITKANDGYIIDFQTENEIETIHTKCIINCAGLNANNISQMVGIDIPEYNIKPCKGEYFSISNPKTQNIKRLIYPVPMKNLKGLGIHATKSLNGTMKLGPNAFYIDNLDYDVELEHKSQFFNAASRYLPFLNEDDLNPDMAGIRPKIQSENDNFKDFIIKNEKALGFNNFINLIGIESPGLTSCLSIAEYVCNECLKNFKN